jgi:hypothetical protein
MLCRGDEENIKHLLMNFPFVKEVWKEVYSMTRGIGKWEHPSLVDCLKMWMVLNYFMVNTNLIAKPCNLCISQTIISWDSHPMGIDLTVD